MSTKKTKNFSPNAAIRKAWKAVPKNTLEPIFHRSYMTETIAGLLPSLFELAKRCEAEAGFIHVPGKIADIPVAWPNEAPPLATGLYISAPQRDFPWMMPRKAISETTMLGREFFALWASRNVSLLVTAKSTVLKQRFAAPKRRLWQVDIVHSPKCLLPAVEGLISSGSLHPDIDKQLTLIHDIIAGQDYEVSDAKTLLASLYTGLALADTVDPITQNRLDETYWITLQHQLQETVFGELRSERLLPLIGQALRRVFPYDFVEIHVFSKVGARYEEFVSWRKNYTGYGDDRISILLKETLVDKLLRDRRPQLVKAERADGVMNPHLLQLAGLNEGVLIPLVHSRKVHGLLIMFNRKPMGIGPNDMERISKIGNLVARSLEASNVHSRVQQMATMDPLTNLHNRRFFNEQLKREFKRAQRYGLRLSAIMLDIDHFKHYNDTHGHLLGDRVLKELAKILRESVRAEDTVARFGGEEFVIVLPENSTEGALKAAEKIRTNVVEGDFYKGDEQPLGQLTVSLGVADISDSTVRVPRDLINHADQALYKAKESGRNRVVVYSSDLASDS